MPLIRLVNHHINNKYHCDKMIYIEGLPESTFYTNRAGKRYIREPWQPDVTENIPKEIRNAFNEDGPIKVNRYIPSPEKGIPPIDEEIECYALSVDYQNGQGEQAWRTIERIIDRETPRGEPIPEPVVVAIIDDEHRDSPFSITSEDIPVVRIKAIAEEKKEEKPILVTASSVSRRCPVCSKSFDRDKGIAMHYRKTGHKPTAALVEA